MNLRYLDGQATLQGPKILLGAEETYEGVCFGCYEDQLFKAQAGFSDEPISANETNLKTEATENAF